MSTSETGVNTPNMLSINRNTAEIFLGCNTFESATYTNSTGSDVVLVSGTLMGRISSSSILDTLKSAATDGSQFPVGILASPESLTVADGETVNVSICVSGKVSKSGVVLDGTDTLETVIDSRQIQDRIASDTLGIKLLASTDLTGYDN